MSGNRGRVLLISPQPFFQWRGSPIRVGFDALGLAQLGFSVDLLTLPIGAEKDMPNVRVLRVSNPFFIRNISIGPSFGKLLFDALLLLKGLRLAIRNRYDYIHCIEDAGPAGLIIAKFAGARQVFEKHSDPCSYRGGRLRNLVMRAYESVEAFVVRRADAVIGTGPALVEQAKAMNPSCPVHHIFDIPSSLAEPGGEETAARRRELSPKPDEILVTYAGSFAAYQGIDVIFDSIPLVVNRHAAARFIIIGGTRGEIAARRKAASLRGVESHVTFVGTVPPDELPAYLAASDILLSPRLAGVNTPLKLLDYLKAGRAIVAADNLASRQILDDTCSVLAKPEPEAFASAISGLILDAGLRERLGERGRRLIAERYNFTEFKKLLDACYRGIEQERPATAGV